MVRLGLNLGYWGAGNDAANLALAREADRLGFAVVWAAEAYGSDAATVLAWVAAQTERIDVGSAILQIPARSPAMTAMTAATLDTLSGGRFRLGVGVSGPQVPLVVGEDWGSCADAVRPYAALYVGGMGSREQNFYNNMAVRMGFPDAAALVQDRYLARDYVGAQAAVPVGFLDATSLLGPK